MRRGAPSACPGPAFRLAGCGRVPGVGAVVCWVPWRPGSVRYGSRLWRAERVLRWGKGGRGNRALGGFPGSPGALQFPGPAGAARYWLLVARIFLGHWRGELLLFGEAGMGWGKTWNRAVFFGAGGFRVSPQCVSGLVPPVYSCSRAVLFPTSPSARWGGEVGNTEAARSERVSAGRRGIETQTPRTAPALAGAVLYVWCLGRLVRVWGAWATRLTASISTLRPIGYKGGASAVTAPTNSPLSGRTGRSAPGRTTRPSKSVIRLSPSIKS